MTKHSAFRYFKPGPGFLDYLAWVCGLGIKSHGPRIVKHPPTSAFTVTCAQLALDDFARAAVLGPAAGVTVPNRNGSAAIGASGPPYRRAPRLGPRPFSVRVVNSFGGNFVW